MRSGWRKEIELGNRPHVAVDTNVVIDALQATCPCAALHVMTLIDEGIIGMCDTFSTRQEIDFKLEEHSALAERGRLKWVRDVLEKAVDMTGTAYVGLPILPEDPDDAKFLRVQQKIRDSRRTSNWPRVYGDGILVTEDNKHLLCLPTRAPELRGQIMRPGQYYDLLTARRAR